MAALEIDTPHGLARAHLHPAAGAARAALMLGHGAGGGVNAPDLAAVTAAATGEGVSVALVEQPYRVAGRRSPARAPQLDAAWTAVAAELRAGPLADLPLVTGGRSMGARVACRTAAATGAEAVLCLAYPVRPPGGRGVPEEERLRELDDVRAPVLVIQGRSDPFGMPPPGPSRTVVEVEGNHGLNADLPAVAEAARAWLMVLVAVAGR